MSERLIAARYRTMERLGAGGMAAVWHAIDTKTGRDVAIKRLLPGVGRDPAARERLRREARAMSSVHHPNIVQVIDVVDDDGSPAIVMDRIDGVTLGDRLRAGTLPERDALGVAIDVTDALAAAHAAGFVHRDVKPGNILLADDGRARLLDFGIAADLSGAADDLTVDGVVGTLRYLAPERLLGEDATTATDVWGVGVTLFEAVAGQAAFPATTLVERVETAGRAVERPTGIADGTWAVIRRAADGDPARRYPDGAALASALHAARDAVTGAPIDDAAVTAVIPVAAMVAAERPSNQLAHRASTTSEGRRRAPAISAALAVLLVAGVGLAALTLDPGARDDSAPGPAADPAAIPIVATSSPPPAISPTPAPVADGADKDQDKGNGKGKGKGNGKGKGKDKP